MSAQNPSFSYSSAQLQELAESILKLAKQKGASAAAVDVSEGFGQNVSVRCGEVETIEYNRDKGIGVAVYLGQRKGNASTSDFSPKALEDTVDAAINIARFTAEDDCAGLASPEILAKDSPDLDLYHPWAVGVDDSIAIALSAENAAFAHDKRILNSEGASLSTEQAHFISANSAGFMGGFPTSRHALHCSVIAEEGDAMQRDDWYSTCRRHGELDSPESIGQKAAARAVARLNSRKIPTGTYPVIFDTTLAGSLVGSLVYAASGSSLYRRASFLVDKLGQRIMSPHINICERPFLKRGWGSSPFDGDGVATNDRDVILNGVLQGYFLSVYSGRKLGLPTTGNAGGSHNLIVEPGKDNLNALCKKMHKGLLVTELLGHGINYVTGDYSRGAAGFWIENGEIVHSVEEITIADNLQEMFKNIIAVGNDSLNRSAKHCGSVLIEKMTIAG